MLAKKVADGMQVPEGEEEGMQVTEGEEEGLQVTEGEEEGIQVTEAWTRIPTGIIYMQTIMITITITYITIN